jgi:putative FmdB family regulatory protein
MPIYEYRCPNGHTFELLQRMSDPQPTECEVCGAAPVEKVLHPVPVFFKGSGFYSTDYGRKSKKSADAGDGAGAKKDESSSTASKSETKAETSSGS